MGCGLSTAQIAQTGSGSSSSALDSKARGVNAIVHDDVLKTPAGSDAAQGSGNYVAAAAAVSGSHESAPALLEGDLYERLVHSPETVSANIRTSAGGSYDIRYAYVSQRGYYPDAPDKANQDNFAVTAN
eukprot:8062-Heterococcus_DN1.PRE.1